MTAASTRTVHGHGVAADVIAVSAIPDMHTQSRNASMCELNGTYANWASAHAIGVVQISQLSSNTPHNGNVYTDCFAQKSVSFYWMYCGITQIYVAV